MEIPQGVSILVEAHEIAVKGPKGEVRKPIPKRATVKVDGGKIAVSSSDKALVGTVESIVRSMVHGVREGYTRNLKLLYAHFPISVEVKGRDVLVKNFLGEKMPRKTVLVGDTKIQAKGQSVTVSGPDKEAVGQTIANLRAAMRIRDKDGRVFQDGLYEAGE